jgi:hypothetical protein
VEPCRRASTLMSWVAWYLGPAEEATRRARHGSSTTSPTSIAWRDRLPRLRRALKWDQARGATTSTMPRDSRSHRGAWPGRRCARGPSLPERQRVRGRADGVAPGARAPCARRCLLADIRSRAPTIGRAARRRRERLAQAWTPRVARRDHAQHPLGSGSGCLEVAMRSLTVRPRSEAMPRAPRTADSEVAAREALAASRPPRDRRCTRTGARAGSRARARVAPSTQRRSTRRHRGRDPSRRARPGARTPRRASDTSVAARASRDSHTRGAAGRGAPRASPRSSGSCARSWFHRPAHRTRWGRSIERGPSA